MAWSILNRSVLFGTVWLALAGASGGALLAGTLAVAAAVWLSLWLLPHTHSLHLWRLAQMMPGFVGGSVLGGIDVARCAFAPRLRLSPGWLLFPVRLSGSGAALLGIEISLMPGTLIAGRHKDGLLLHVLDRDAGYEDALPVIESQLAAVIATPHRAREA